MKKGDEIKSLLDELLKVDEVTEGLADSLDKIYHYKGYKLKLSAIVIGRPEKDN